MVVGEGREKFGHVFLADTGTSNGDITGQSRPINTVDLKVIFNTLIPPYKRCEIHSHLDHSVS